jgi:hypothetical protein
VGDEYCKKIQTLHRLMDCDKPTKANIGRVISAKSQLSRLVNSHQSYKWKIFKTDRTKKEIVFKNGSPSVEFRHEEKTDVISKMDAESTVVFHFAKYLGMLFHPFAHGNIDRVKLRMNIPQQTKSVKHKAL